MPQLGLRMARWAHLLPHGGWGSALWVWPGHRPTSPPRGSTRWVYKETDTPFRIAQEKHLLQYFLTEDHWWYSRVIQLSRAVPHVWPISIRMSLSPTQDTSIHTISISSKKRYRNDTPSTPKIHITRREDNFHQDLSWWGTHECGWNHKTSPFLGPTDDVYEKRELEPAEFLPSLRPVTTKCFGESLIASLFHGGMLLSVNTKKKKKKKTTKLKRNKKKKNNTN